MRRRLEDIAERGSARILARSVLWANVKAYHQPRVRVGRVVAQPRIVVVARGHLPIYGAIRKSLERSIGEPKGLLAEVAAVRGDESDELVQAMEGRAPRWGSPDRFDPSLFLYELVRSTRPETVIEFGTAYGQGSLHIIAALSENQQGHLYTVELDPRRRERALAAFARFPTLDRITSIEADMRDEAGPLAERVAPVDLVFEDGPHDGTTTLAAFEATIEHVKPGGIYVVDDIAQEPEQESAWVRIRNDRRVAGSLEINGRHGVCIRA